jgi:phosphoribosylformylglycinamidine synthase
MSKPRVLVLRAPGTNCDVETAFAFEMAGAVADRVHVQRVIDNPTIGERYQILCLPGGFSYGDDIAAGRILAVHLREHLGEAIRQFCEGDHLVLGICNGFQVLMRLGILSDDISETSSAATLSWNNHGRFEDRWVHLRTSETHCVFLQDIESMYLPIAHAEGKFVMASAAVREQLNEEGRLALRYAPDSESDYDAEQALPFPLNPNGAEANVAGLCDITGRLFGLMPHPERHLDPTHHPHWTRRRTQPEFGDGMAIFQNAVNYFG